MNFLTRAKTPKSTTGRSKFSRYRRLLNLLAVTISILPNMLRSFLWDMTRPFSGPLALSIRYALLKARTKHLGDTVYIGRNTTFLNSSQLTIGDNVSIHEGCYIDSYGGCEIGSNVSIAHGCSLLTFNHTWDDPKKPIKYNPVKARPVQIHDDVWIGARVSIMAGVTIKSRSIIAAGAVVTHDVEPNTVNAGIPAKKLRDL